MALDDNHLFYFGEVYVIDDTNIRFVPRKDNQVDPDKERFVAIVQNDRENNDSAYPILTVVPITKRVDGKTKQCLEIEPGDAGMPLKSLVKAGLIQPIAKKDLKRRKGKLKPDSIRKLYALLYGNLGFREVQAAVQQAQGQHGAEV